MCLDLRDFRIVVYQKQSLKFIFRSHEMAKTQFMKHTLSFLSLFFLVPYIQAQYTQDFHTPEELYHLSRHLYEEGNYGPAAIAGNEYLNSEHVFNHYISPEYREEILSIIKLSGLALKTPESENQLITFIKEHYPDPSSYDAIVALGSLYYNERKYDQSIAYYEKIDLGLLPDEISSEANFKCGYSHFVLKEFVDAKEKFGASKEIRNRYFYPNNYYYGMIQYFDGDYAGAVQTFKRVENSSAYSPLIPYYICQIYFAQNQFDELISYGEQKILQANVQRKNFIRLLLGQAYFREGLYQKALPHLEYYEAHTDKLTKEEFYQLAFTQYQLGLYEKAVDNFREIALLNSKLGQLVNYYIADCYLQLDDKTSARTAFKKVMDMSFEPRMTEEATFNFGKISAELNFDREAINTLVAIPESSPFYRKSRSIVNDLLLNSEDFENSIAIIESLGRLEPDLEDTYQIISFKRGIQLFNDGNLDNSKVYFEKSLRYPNDVRLVTQTQFWKAYMQSVEGNLAESIDAFDVYFTMSNGLSGLPEESSPYIAHYTQGYNYLKNEAYGKSSFHFKNAIVGINLIREEIGNEYILKRILPDALLRAGDCMFKNNAYEEALIYYNQSIDRNATGFMYAMFQKGLIQGLLNQPYEKILTLEDLSRKYPASEYADDALLSLGDTYLNLGNTGPASISYNRIITYYKGKSNLINAAYLKLGLISYNQGDSDQALLYYKEVFNNNPNSKESQEALISIEEIYIDDLGQTEDYFAFLGTIPGYEVSAFARDSLNYQIAKSQYDDGEYERSISSFDKYLTKYDKGYYRLEARFFRAESNSILKNYNKALRDYEYIVKEGLNDNYLSSLRKAAIISFNYTQNFSKSYTYYSSLAVEAKAEEEIYEAELGALRSAFKISSHPSIIKYANKVIANPLSSSIEKYTAYFYLGKASYNTGNFKDAKYAFQQVSNRNNRQAAESNFLLAQMAYDNKDYDGAEQQVNVTTEKSSNYPYWVARSLILLSDIYVSKNDLFNARAALEAVRDNFKENSEIADTTQSKLTRLAALEEKTSRVKPAENGNQLELDTTNGGNGGK